jgi:hypothetical protein
MELIESNIGWLFKIGATVLSIGICWLASRKFDNVLVTVLVFFIANFLLLEIIKTMGIDVPFPGKL